MKTTRLLYTLSIVLFSLIVSCSEEETLKMEGTIIGFVELVDEEGRSMRDNGNVKISLNDKIFVTSDATGRFEFNGVEAGTYQVLFEKEGFGLVRQFNLVFAGGNKPAIIQSVKLFQAPSLIMSNFKVERQSYNQLYFSWSIPNKGQYLIRYYIGKDQNVSNEHYDFSSMISFCCTAVPQFGQQIFLPDDLLQNTDKLYIKVYAENISPENIGYYDYELEKQIRTAVQKVAGPLEVTL